MSRGPVAALPTGDINAMPLLESDGRTVEYRLQIARCPRCL